MPIVVIAILLIYFDIHSQNKPILMKTYRLLLGLVMLVTLSTACTRRVYVTKTHNVNHLPPGQAKKIYGGKSAKAYAPGQRKKN
jgi:hypothetical protein